MTKFFITALCCFTFLLIDAQSPFSQVQLQQKEDYKAAEQKVLEASNFLFATKHDKDDLDRLYAIEFVVKWMTGTPDYTFEIGEKFSKAFAGDADLLGLYMAAMVKYVLENKGKDVDSKTVGLNASKTVIQYSSNASNNLKQTGELKKMATAWKKGELEKYLGI